MTNPNFLENRLPSGHVGSNPTPSAILTNKKHLILVIFTKNQVLFTMFCTLKSRFGSYQKMTLGESFLLSQNHRKALWYKAFSVLPWVRDFGVFGQFYRIFHGFCGIFLAAPVQMRVNIKGYAYGGMP